MKAIALALFGMLMAVLSTGCCCGSLCGGGGCGYRGCGYAPAVDHCAPACPSPCNPCTPTYGAPGYGAPLQGTYIAPTTTQASGIPSVMTASAVPMESLPTY